MSKFDIKIGLAKYTIIIFQDFPHAASTNEITNELNLTKIKDRKWYIMNTNAMAGEGLYEGLDWIHYVLEKK